MLKAEPDESQNGNKTAGRNTDNLRYAVDAMLMAECKEELKRLLMRVKERVKKLTLNIQKLRSWHLVPSLQGK